MDSLLAEDAVVPCATQGVVVEQPAVATITTITREFKKAKDCGSSVWRAPTTFRKDGERKRLPPARKIVGEAKAKSLAARVSAAYSLQSSLTRPLPPLKSILKAPTDIKKDDPCSHNRTITFGTNDTRIYNAVATVEHAE